MSDILAIIADQGDTRDYERLRVLELHDCLFTRLMPGLVIEEELIIVRNGITVSFTFGDQIMIAIHPAKPPMSVIAGLTGRPIHYLVELPNLAGHPLHEAVIVSVEFEYWGIDVIATCPDPWCVIENDSD